MDLFARLAPTPVKRYTLRSYQDDAVQAGMRFFQEEDNDDGHALMVEPTGSGKSLIIAGIVNELNDPTLVFQPSREILMQNYQKLKDYGYHPAIFSASLKKRRIGDITLATIGTVNNSLRQFGAFKNIIIDEAHRVDPKAEMQYKNGKLEIVSEPMYLRVVNALTRTHPNLKVLGATATPYRLHSTREFGPENRFLTRTKPKLFGRVIHHTQISDLIEGGWWCPMRYYPIPGFTRAGVRMNSSGSDFTDEALLKRYEEIGFAKMVLDTVSSLQTMCKSILVFTKFVYEARSLAQRLPRCAVVSKDTPDDERDAIVKKFRSGEIQVLANVGVFTTGFDHPPVDAVVLARPTFSLALYYQMAGRGSRPDPSKDHCKLVDMCENMPLFGKLETMRLVDTGNGKWVIMNEGRQLTNVPHRQLG